MEMRLEVEKELKKRLKKLCKQKGVELIIDTILPIIEVQTLNRYIILNRSRISNGYVGLVEMISSLDSGFRQVSELLRRPGITMIPKYNDAVMGEELNEKLLMDIVEGQIVNMLMTTNCVYYIISSARRDVLSIKRFRQGDLILAFDPIDGLDNAKTVFPMGTTFGIYSPNQEFENYKDLLCTCGKESLIVSGYAVYGSSTILIISFRSENRVLEFCYDLVIGEFVLVNDNVKIPVFGNTCCVDNGTRPKWLRQELVNFLPENNALIKHRGSLVANFHFILKTGGVVVDPPTSDYPNGQIISKLNPLAMICNTAGGMSYGNNLLTNLIEIIPKSLYETTPCIMGSKKLIIAWTKQVQKEASMKKKKSLF